MGKWFNRRMAVLWLIGVVLLIAFLSLTHVRVLPCWEFISDSTEGYYPYFCPLVDDDGVFLFSSEQGYYDPVPTPWSWVFAVGLILVLPYVAAWALDRKIKR